MRYLRTLFFTFLCMTLMSSCTGGNDEPINLLGQELKVSPETMTFSATGGTTTLYVQSAQEPHVSVEADWCRVTPVTSSSEFTYKYSVSVPAYDEHNDRQIQVIISANGKQLSTTVRQTAADGLIIVTNTFDVEAQGGTIEVKLKANGKVEANPLCEWINPALTRANMEDCSTSFTVDSNPGPMREGAISFTLGNIIETVKVIQASGLLSDGIDVTAMEIAREMYPGWNLGNTLEASNNGLGAETAWQPTKTTQELIDYVASLGFRCIRIPCNWYGHMDESHIIDPAWMNRVREVVDYCIKDDLYVVLNDHYDHGWLEHNIDPFQPELDAILRTMWEQIATYFQGYDKHLLFAGLNEPDAPTEEATANLVKYEETFIDAVRKTGGNNAQRILVVQGPMTNIDKSYDWYTKMPADPAENRLMAEVHFYSPWNFCGMSEDASWGYRAFFWGAENHVEGSNYNATWGEEDYVREQMQKMKVRFADQGIPVLIGEFAGLWRLIEEHQDKNDASVQHYYEVVTREAAECGCIACAWDTNYCTRSENGNSTIINRSELKLFNPFAMKGIQEGAAKAKWPY